MRTTPRILIADDERMGREVLRSALAAGGYEIYQAVDGEEAMTITEQVQPDLILLDVMMPKCDGFEFCRRLRARPQLAQIPVVLVTALDDRDSKILGIQAGADDFLSKPVDRVELRARVQTITRLNRYQRLMTERARFERIAEQAREGYVLVNPSGEIDYTNPAAGKYLGLATDRGEARVNFLQAATGGYRLEPASAWEHGLDSILQSPDALRYLVRGETPQSVALWLRVERVAMPAESPDLLLLLRDVTGELGTRREMWQFHAMLSHKFRTPLNGLLGILGLMESGVQDLNPADIAALVGDARSCAERLNGQINDVLEFTDSSRQGQPGSAEGFSLRRLEEEVREQGKEEGIERIEVEIEPEVAGCVLPWSGEQMRTVLDELLENAHKFHPRKSPFIRVAARAEGPGRVKLRFEDDGVNIPAERLPQVWIPYFQGEKHFTGEIHGMGLGLAMVASLVWEHGGRCLMSNRTDGPGVVVEIVLPTVLKNT